MTSFKTTTFLTFLGDMCCLDATQCSTVYATGGLGSAISRNDRLACGRVNKNLENKIRALYTVAKDK